LNGQILHVLRRQPEVGERRVPSVTTARVDRAGTVMGSVSVGGVKASVATMNVGLAVVVGMVRAQTEVDVVSLTPDMALRRVVGREVARVTSIVARKARKGHTGIKELYRAV
jgi:hypothetical protein